MGKPFHWLRLAQRLSDEKLVEITIALIAQSHNEHWKHDAEAQAWLESKLAEFTDEIANRIAQGTLF